jgi:hypothetical protein
MSVQCHSADILNCLVLFVENVLHASNSPEYERIEWTFARHAAFEKILLRCGNTVLLVYGKSIEQILEHKYLENIVTSNVETVWESRKRAFVRISEILKRHF